MADDYTVPGPRGLDIERIVRDVHGEDIVELRARLGHVERLCVGLARSDTQLERRLQPLFDGHRARQARIQNLERLVWMTLAAILANAEWILGLFG